MNNITEQELKNLEIAVSTAIKQTSILMFMAMCTKEQSFGGLTIKQILESTNVLQEALTTIDKLKTKP